MEKMKRLVLLVGGAICALSLSAQTVTFTATGGDKFGEGEGCQQVLDNNNVVIEGLYVAGNTMARFMGMVYQMNKQSGTSCGRAVTSGRLAARFALGDM